MAKRLEKSAVVRPFWPPMFAGLALGLVLMLTFLFTGHGLGATGFTTRLTAWLWSFAAPEAASGNSYLGPMLDDGRPLASWISWEVVGVALGALGGAYSAGRWRLQIAGAATLGAPRRILLALAGGLFAGFGARVAAGCTSGIGLSGGATLSIAAFVFLGAFFVAGLATSRLLLRPRAGGRA